MSYGPSAGHSKQSEYSQGQPPYYGAQEASRYHPHHDEIDEELLAEAPPPYEPEGSTPHLSEKQEDAELDRNLGWIAASHERPQHGGSGVLMVSEVGMKYVRGHEILTNTASCPDSPNITWNPESIQPSLGSELVRVQRPPRRLFAISGPFECL